MKLLFFAVFAINAEHSGDSQHDASSVCGSDTTLCDDIPGTVCVDTDLNNKGYFCPCRSGFEVDLNTGKCLEQDICQRNESLCTEVPFTICVATSHTTEGYFCPCQTGYKVDVETGNCIPEVEPITVDVCSLNVSLCSDVPNTVCVARRSGKGYFCPCRRGYEVDYLTGQCRLIQMAQEEEDDYTVVEVTGGEENTETVTATTPWDRSKYFATMSTPASHGHTAIVSSLLMLYHLL
jgi:hypothetical protein